MTRSRAFHDVADMAQMTAMARAFKTPRPDARAVEPRPAGDLAGLAAWHAAGYAAGPRAQEATTAVPGDMPGTTAHEPHKKTSDATRENAARRPARIEA